MPNEDERFSDVAEQLKQTEESAEAETTAPDKNGSSQGNGVPADPPETPPGQDSSDEEESPDDPAFSFDETEMHGFYVRNETWGRVTRMRSSVTAVCSMFDLTEFEGREFQDACLRVIADHGDEVALQILEERGIDADEKRVDEVMAMLSEQAADE